MKNTTIQSLRQAGYKVRVIHRGLADTHINMSIPLDVQKSIKNIVIAADGHPCSTQIDITTPDGQHATGYAFRAKGDQYDRKKGNTIALGRALKQLNIG